MRLVLPLPPNLANSRLFWAAKHREKKNYWALLDTYQSIGGLAFVVGFKVPAPPAKPFERVRIDAHWFLHGVLMDEGNAYNRLKWIEDYLTTRGYIVDDSTKHVELGRPKQEADRKNQRVEITITEGTR